MCQELKHRRYLAMRDGSFLNCLPQRAFKLDHFIRNAIANSANYKSMFEQQASFRKPPSCECQLV